MKNKTRISNFVTNLFFRNLDIKWRSYECISLSKFSPQFFYFLTFLNNVYIFIHSSFFLILLVWCLNPQCWPLFLSVLVSNIFAIIFSFEQHLTSHMKDAYVTMRTCKRWPKNNDLSKNRLGSQQRCVSWGINANNYATTRSDARSIKNDPQTQRIIWSNKQKYQNLGKMWVQSFLDYPTHMKTIVQFVNHKKNIFFQDIPTKAKF